MRLCNCSHQFCKNIPVSFDFINTWNQGVFLCSPFRGSLKNFVLKMYYVYRPMAPSVCVCVVIATFFLPIFTEFNDNIIRLYIYIFFFCGAATQRGSRPPHSWGFFLITHNDAPQSVELLWTSDQLVAETQKTHNRQTSMPPEGFESTLSVGERPQSYALDRAATGTGTVKVNLYSIVFYTIKTW